MQWLVEILKLMANLFIPIASYQAGKKSKEKDILEDENKDLKEYANIENSDVSDADVNDARMW